jgi:elongation factor G
MHANKREEVETCYAGNIYAAVGLRDTRTGDTLCDEKHPIVLEKMEFPDPVISIAIEPKTKADLDKLGHEPAEARVRGSRASAPSPTKRPGRRSSPAWASCTSRSSSTACAASSRSTPTSASPRSPTARAIQKAVTKVEGRFVRQTGGHGQYGHVVIDLEPGERGSGFVFENDDRRRHHPEGVHPLVEKGMREAMNRGVLIGLPHRRLKVRLSTAASTRSTRRAPRSRWPARSPSKRPPRRPAWRCSSPSWPSRSSAPRPYLGDVIGDLNSRRGKVNDMGQRGNARVISSEVPLATMFGYATDLRSKTQGRATHTMQFAHYAPVPRRKCRKRSSRSTTSG